MWFHPTHRSSGDYKNSPSPKSFLAEPNQTVKGYSVVKRHASHPWPAAFGFCFKKFKRRGFSYSPEPGRFLPLFQYVLKCLWVYGCMMCIFFLYLSLFFNFFRTEYRKSIHLYTNRMVDTKKQHQKQHQHSIMQHRVMTKWQDDAFFYIFSQNYKISEALHKK